MNGVEKVVNLAVNTSFDIFNRYTINDRTEYKLEHLTMLVSLKNFIYSLCYVYPSEKNMILKGCNDMDNFIRIIRDGRLSRLN